jgi:hypothetical protein
MRFGRPRRTDGFPYHEGHEDQRQPDEFYYPEGHEDHELTKYDPQELRVLCVLRGSTRSLREDRRTATTPSRVLVPRRTRRSRTDEIRSPKELRVRYVFVVQPGAFVRTGGQPRHLHEFSYHEGHEDHELTKYDPQKTSCSLCPSWFKHAAIAPLCVITLTAPRSANPGSATSEQPQRRAQG